MKTRKTRPRDYPEIEKLLDRAFAPSISESELVRTLRDRGEISLEMVIEQNGTILGYICYTRAYDRGRNPIGFHLAPLGVLPSKQRRGLGRRLISDSLEALDTPDPVYVLGDPDYYSRSGFKRDKTQKCVFEPGGYHFLVLSSGPLPPREVGYEKEFHDLAGIPDSTPDRNGETGSVPRTPPPDNL